MEFETGLTCSCGKPRDRKERVVFMLYGSDEPNGGIYDFCLECFEGLERELDVAMRILRERRSRNID